MCPKNINKGKNHFKIRRGQYLLLFNIVIKQSQKYYNKLI
jgi:hypothetical protein